MAQYGRRHGMMTNVSHKEASQTPGIMRSGRNSFKRICPGILPDPPHWLPPTAKWFKRQREKAADGLPLDTYCKVHRRILREAIIDKKEASDQMAPHAFTLKAGEKLCNGCAKPYPEASMTKPGNDGPVCSDCLPPGVRVSPRDGGRCAGCGGKFSNSEERHTLSDKEYCQGYAAQEIEKAESPKPFTCRKCNKNDLAAGDVISDGGLRESKICLTCAEQETAPPL